MASRRFSRLLFLLLASSFGCESILGIEDTQARRSDPASGGIGFGGAVSESGGKSSFGGTSGQPSAAAAGSLLSGAAGDGQQSSVPGDGGGFGDAGRRHDGADRGGAPVVNGGGGAGAITSESGGASGTESGGAGGAGAAGGRDGSDENVSSGAGNGAAGAPSGVTFGSLVGVDNLCVDIAAASDTSVSDSRVVLRPCDGGTVRRWRRDTAGRFQARGLWNGFLALGDELQGGGLEVRVTEVSGVSAAWDLIGVELIAVGDLRVRLATDNRRVELAEQSHDPSQRWTFTINQEFMQGSVCIDIPDNYAIPGQHLQGYACNNNNNQRFPLASGNISFDGLCFNAQGSPPKVGSAIGLAACASPGQPGSASQSFYLRGPVQNQGLCLSAPAPAYAGDSVVMLPCDGRREQQWEWHF